MADIKTKNVVKDTIKKIDRTTLYTAKLKDNIVDIKNKGNYNQIQDNTPNEYGANKITNDANIVFHKGTRRINKYGKESLPVAKKSIENMKNANYQIQRIKTIRKRANNIKNIRKANNTIKTTTKQTERTIKTAKNTGKTIKSTAKATKKTAEKTAKSAKKAYQISKQVARQTVKTIKRAIKATILAIKAILAGVKALIAFLIAGGWVALIIIIVICLIALICGSIFGIFFASEDTGSVVTVGEMKEPITMNQVISDLNIEFMEKIKQIQNNNEYEEYEITSNRAEWKDVLAIYSVKVNGGNNETEVLTLNDEKVNTLKEIFWEFNEINHWTTGEKITSDMTYIEYVTAEPLTLHIEIKSKTVEEMAKKYNFNNEQMKQLAELTDSRYASMWSSVIYGSSVGSNDIVASAISQIGNVGGQPYWSWYGFNSRVEWCACFVSWCANECGYIEAGVIPKFAGCANGVNWFKACDLWRDRGFIPKARRYYIL